ncbi:Pin4p [Sporobolomyces salmoneus]|uniref:Pin4p n=1 Tax=Sporobolomyces salmoneus TaxID=183962 RepID=UPI00316FEC97
MEVGLVSAFEEFGLHSDVATTRKYDGNQALNVPGSNDSRGNDNIRKQRSQRFTVPLSPPREASSSTHDLLANPSLPFQPSPPPVQTQSLSHPEELYSTPHDQFSRAPDVETRREYAGSDSSSDSPETPYRPLPTESSSTHRLNFLQTHPGQQPQYSQHQTPVFYNSTSHSSMPLSPPSLFNLVPGGSPGFTYHHSFPQNSPPTQHYQPAPHQASNAYSSFVAPPPPPPSQPYANNFGLGVATGGGDMGAGMGMGMPGGTTRRNPSPGYQTDGDDDEIIETAIVIKSIPFSCPKDQLLALMTSLQLPTPLAFNYHYDLSLNPGPQNQEPRQDQFRGLAFANFRNGEEAKMVVFALNGFEFMGRKLRAEFKKVLKPGEKEAIERNKALKRIRSVQILANGGNPNGMNGSFAKGGGAGGGRGNGWGDGGLNGSNSFARGGGGGGKVANGFHQREASNPGFNGYRHYEPDETTTEEYGRLLHSHSQAQLHGKPSFGQKEYVVPSGIGMAYGDSGESLIGGSGSLEMSGSGSASGTSSFMSSGVETGGDPRSGSGSDSEEGVGSSVSAREEMKKDLDLNDPQTLQLYSQLLLFSSSPSPPYPSTTEFEGLTERERRTLKMVASMLRLGYGSEDNGVGGKRVRVWKTNAQPTLRTTSSAAPLRRPASTSSFRSGPTVSSSFVPPPVPPLPAFSAYLAAPNSGGLRGKKSMPEFRPSSSNQFYAHDAPQMPTSNFSQRPPVNSFGRKSTNNLRSESPPRYQSQTPSTYSSPSSRRVRESPSVQGLFQQQEGFGSEGPEGRKEFYSSGLGSSGAEAVRQPRGPGSGASSPARVVGADGGALEWRARRT